MTILDLSDRWGQLQRGEALDVPPPVPSPASTDKEFRFYRPLADAADDYVRYAQSPHEQVYTGIAAVDNQMRGIAPGEMCLIIGHTHNGKTLVLLEMLRHNANRNVLYFCPDEPRTLTLSKLASLVNDIDAITLEDRIRSDDPSALAMLRKTAREDFPNLAVIDDSVSLVDMEKAWHEVSEVWGQAPDLVVFDYLQLLNGGGEDVPSKANALKGWGRRHDVPLLVLHQTSRTSGSSGKQLTIDSGAYGGEQQATHIIGVRRKLFEIKSQIREIEERAQNPSRERGTERLLEALESLRLEERIHQHTLTVNLVKNKRVGGRLVEDIDFEITYGTGRLKPLLNGDLPYQYRMKGMEP
jgi:KaiC/GvpD/RAD55 family RecA-like ATPase